MKFRSLGQILRTEYYAQTPTPMVMDDRIRIYYAEREIGRAFMKYTDFHLENPAVVKRHGGRVLDAGKPLAFDQDGQMPSFAMRVGDDVQLYYSGWFAAQNGYHNATGIVFSEDGGKSFKRGGDGPILDRTLGEPYLAVTPCIAPNGRMFYISGLRWEEVNGKLEPIYVIRSAVSRDGLNWHRDSKIIIPQAHPQECFSRPWCIRREDGWHLFYCFRSAVDYRDGANAYQLGHATSPDCEHWTRLDDVELERQDWNSKMQAYPSLFDVGGKLYLLTNGNTFGKYGFGLAVAQ